MRRAVQLSVGSDDSEQLAASNSTSDDGSDEMLSAALPVTLLSVGTEESVMGFL